MPHPDVLAVHIFAADHAPRDVFPIVVSELGLVDQGAIPGVGDWQGTCGGESVFDTVDPVCGQLGE